MKREGMTMRDLLDEYLPIDRTTAYRLVAEGKIPHVRVGHRIIFYRRKVEEWLAGGGMS